MKEKARKAIIRDILAAMIHEGFTVAADRIAQLGYINQDERIELSKHIGDALGSFNEAISEVGDREIDPDDVTTIAEKAAASTATGPGTLFGGGGILSTPGIEGGTMPYGVFKTGSDDKPFCVYRVDEDGDKSGKSLGCHPSKAAANSQIRAIGMATHKMGGEMDTELAIGGKPYTSEHACRLRSPAGFQEGSFRRMSRESDGKKYSIIIGRLEGEETATEQAYRYNREVWTEESARTHCKDHDGSFEAATGEEKSIQPVIVDMRTSAKEESQEEEIRVIESSFRKVFPGRTPTPAYESRPWIMSTYDTYVIVSIGEEYYHVAYSQSGDGYTFAPMDEWQEVERAPEQWIAKKAGRRLRSDKLSALQSLKKKFDEMLKELASLVGWADYDDQKPFGPFRSSSKHSGISGFKGADGRDWLLTWTTNAFIDKDEEIFTTKSIEDYVARHTEGYGPDPSTWSKKGDFLFWHLPGAKFADILWQGMSGRFLVEAGPFCDGVIADTFKAFFQAHPNGHQDIAPTGWGASHGYLYEPKDREDKVYDWFEKRETSILPASAAANPYNPQMEVFKVDQKQLDALKTIGDEDLVALVIETGEGLTKELEDERIAFKAKKAFSAQLQTIAESLKEDGPKKELIALATQIADLEGAAIGDDEDKTEKAPPGRKQAVSTEEPVADDKDLKEGLRTFVPQLRTISESVEGDAGKELGVIIDAIEASADRKEEDPPEKDESEFVTRDELMPALKLISRSVLDLRTMIKELAVSDKEKITKIVEDTPKASLENIVAQTLIGREETLIDGRKGLAKDGPKETQPAPEGKGFGIPLLDNIKQLNQQYSERL